MNIQPTHFIQLWRAILERKIDGKTMKKKTFTLKKCHFDFDQYPVRRGFEDCLFCHCSYNWTIFSILCKWKSFHVKDEKWYWFRENVFKYGHNVIATMNKNALHLRLAELFSNAYLICALWPQQYQIFRLWIIRIKFVIVIVATIFCWFVSVSMLMHFFWSQSFDRYGICDMMMTRMFCSSIIWAIIWIHLVGWNECYAVCFVDWSIMDIIWFRFIRLIFFTFDTLKIERYTHCTNACLLARFGQIKIFSRPISS